MIGRVLRLAACGALIVGVAYGSTLALVALLALIVIVVELLEVTRADDAAVVGTRSRLLEEWEKSEKRDL